MSRQMCQSCGRPLKDEIRGTEKEDSLSSKYCNLCYERGSFIDPGLTMEQMQKISVQAMRKMHFPKFFATMVTKSQLPKLERWRNK